MSALSLLAFQGCQTTNRSAPAISVDLSKPGWKVRQGQALWRSSRTAPELAGEIVYAMHSDGRGWLQFTKTPLPILSAEVTAGKWRIEFIPEARTFAGKGNPPKRLLWLHLIRAFQGRSPPKPLFYAEDQENNWRLENPSAGETVSGYFEH